ncbi:endo-1,4-beta-xylanase [Pedobacter lithocola]|uniref:endo-1,4-beta-xylanase n=1 Tax=Pedobacter lithocola TaxID=1908239 RepID=A0ABV8PGX8_9SPHI
MITGRITLNNTKTLISIIALLTLTHSLWAQSNTGEVLLPDGIKSFNTSQNVEITTVDGQSFKSALRVGAIEQKPTVIMLKSVINAEIKNGDVLWLGFKMRTLKSKRETGEAFIEVKLDRTINGKIEWPPLFERGISCGQQWTTIKVPILASRDVNKGDLSLTIYCGNMAQVFEIADLDLRNYKQTVQITELPRSVVHYDGDKPDAPWRKAAAERIEKYRKGSLAVKVIDKNGKPVPGATVAVKMKRLNFVWGTAANSKTLLDTLNPSLKNYHDTLFRYFNQVVFENELKWKYWPRYDHNKTKDAVRYLRANNITTQGTVMIWPSWQHSPTWLADIKNDTAALRKAAIDNINVQTSEMKGQFSEWHVLNEPYAHHDIIDLLRRDVMIDWFKAARKGAPGVTLLVNDYTMFHDEEASESFYNTVRFLKEKKAPVDAIGEQGHIGGTPPSIDYVIARLNRFAELGLPIQISEFDITSDDDDFKMNYTRDFLTAVFSNPSVTGVTQWGFWEKQHWIPAAALWDKDWRLKPNGQVFTNLVSKTWATNTDGRTNSKGIYNVKAFNGNYSITVKSGSRQIEEQATITSDGKTITIKLKN